MGRYKSAMAKLIIKKWWRGSSQSQDEDSGKASVFIYCDKKEADKTVFDPEMTCEEVCYKLGEQLGITPAMLHCFNLAAINKSDFRCLWLAPSDQLKSQGSEVNLHFRMRFLPSKDKCDELQMFDMACFKYLFWQLKWDFIHDLLEAYTKKDKHEASRGVVMLCILIMLRLHTEASENQSENLKDFLKENSMKQFLPNSLGGNFLDESYQTKGIVKEVEDNQRKFPVSRCDSVYLMNAYLKFLLFEDQKEEKQFYYAEYYKASIAEGQEVIFTDVQVTVQMGCQYPAVTVVDTTTNTTIFSCQVMDVTDLEMVDLADNKFKVNIRMSAHTKALYFGTRSEAVSCVTCIETYYRLKHDYYLSLCTMMEPNDLKLKRKLRAHGPITDDFVLQKFKKREKRQDSGSRQNVYILRSCPKSYDEFEVLYKDERSGKLKTISLGKVKKNGQQYTLDGIEDVGDLKVLIHKAILKGANTIGTWMRLNMQSEGTTRAPDNTCCDILQNILLGKDMVNLTEEEEEEQSAKVYTESSLELKSLIGQGHFTETYEALLCKKEMVVAKMLRYSEIPDSSFKHVQESFQAGCDVLMTIKNPMYFVEFIGVVMSKTPTVVMKMYKYGNLRAFLQSREPREHLLTIKHLCDVVVKLAHALDYLDENHLCHGNLHCENIMVNKFDRNELNVDIGDPGLITLYNKLGLESNINKRRLPWIAPELYENLFDTTLKSDMFALGTTLWQMFSEGKNPLDVEPALKHKSVQEVCGFFSDTDPARYLSCPLYLKERPDDSDCIKTLKSKLYKEIMRACWIVDPEERINPKLFLKEYNSVVQSYSTDYHDYNVIPDFTSAMYPGQASAALTSGSQSDGFSGVASAIQTRVMPIYDLKLLDRSDHQMGEPVSRQAPEGKASPVPGSPLQDVSRVPDRPGDRGNEESSTAQSPWVLRPGVGLPVPPPNPGVARNSTRSTTLPSRPVNDVKYLIREDRLSIDWDHKVGQGHYGAIYKGTLAPTSNLCLLEPTKVAVKVLRPNIVNDYGQEFIDEAKVMEQLDHKNIVKFYGVCKFGQYLIMEFVENQCLYTFVKKPGVRCAPETLLKFCVDIAAGMEYLSLKKVLHRDLAARNVLITKSLDAKISDFGMSKVLEKDQDYYRRERNVDKNIPVLWSAPEWIGMKKFTTKSDVWSFAVVLWEVYSKGSLPNICKDLEEFKNKGIRWLKEGRRLVQPEKCSHDVYALMLDCWNNDPVKRPSFTECHARLRDIAGLPDMEDIQDDPVDYSRTNLQNDLVPNTEPSNNGTDTVDAGDVLQRLVAHANSVPTVTNDRQTQLIQKGVHGNNGVSSVPNLSRSQHNRVQLLDKSKLLVQEDKPLGRGGFGEVHKGTYEGREVAVKRCTNKEEYDRFKREVNILYNVNHQNIVEFVGAVYCDSDGSQSLQYAMECMRLGSLSSYLKNKAAQHCPLDVPTKIECLINIAQGMAYLFDKRILHCDLTAVNVLLSGTEGNLKTKISDFGWAKEMGIEGTDLIYHRNDARFRMHWAAYEVLWYETLNRYSDIWSYGSLAVEVFGDGRTPDLDPPLSGPTQQQQQQMLMNRLKNKERFVKPEHCPHCIYNDILKRCWAEKPDYRITFKEIVEVLQRTNNNEP